MVNKKDTECHFSVSFLTTPIYELFYKNRARSVFPSAGER